MPGATCKDLMNGNGQMPEILYLHISGILKEQVKRKINIAKTVFFKLIFVLSFKHFISMAAYLFITDFVWSHIFNLLCVYSSQGKF